MDELIELFTLWDEDNFKDFSHFCHHRWGDNWRQIVTPERALDELLQWMVTEDYETYLESFRRLDRLME